MRRAAQRPRNGAGILTLADMQAELYSYAGPGHWNDPDKMTPETSAILLNKDAIAVDQDALGTQGKRVRHENDRDIWVKPLQNGAIAVVMLNRGADAQPIALKP